MTIRSAMAAFVGELAGANQGGYCSSIEGGIAMRKAGRYGLLILFVLAALYCLMAVYQNADFSVAAPPAMAEIYKTRAMLLLPLSGLFLSVGILFFLVLGRSDQNRTD
jgi:hypothetical protein